MTQHNSISATQLLSIEDKVLCTQLKNLESSDTGQRATALLLINDGATQTEAAEKSGLTIGQIRYLVKRFKEKGIEMFPADLLPDQPVKGETAAREPDSNAPSPEETPTEELQEITQSQAIASEPEVETEPAIPKMAQTTKSKNTNRKKASKKRPKRPKPIKKKKKSKRKRKNRK